MFATIVLVVFSVGYVAMARKKTTAGGFYSYISHGLGRETRHRHRIRRGGRLLGIRGVAGRRLRLLPQPEAERVRGQHRLAVAGPRHGASIIAILTYFDVRISTAVLAVGLISEIADPARSSTATCSPRGTSRGSSLNIANAFKGFPAQGKLAAGAVGIGLFFAFWSWVGFEMAPNYGEESKDPKRIVPRALYISVIGLGIFYTMTSWASLGGYPTTTAAIAASQSNAANYFLAPATQYAGHWVSSMMSYLIITGSFACGMAFHNTTARYLYSLGREGLAPKALGRTHPQVEEPAHRVAHPVGHSRHHHRAVRHLHRQDNPSSQAYLQLYGLMAVMGVIIILSVQALVSLSDPDLLRALPQRRGELVEDQAGPADLVLHPGLRGVPAVQEHHVPRRRLQLRELARPDRRRGRRPRHRRRLLLQEVQARQVRDRPAA